MKTHNARILCLCTVVSCLLASVAATPALADYAVDFHNGPDIMVLGVGQLVQFHATLVNTGSSADSYTLTVVKNQPASWIFGVCYGGLCYPPTETEFTIPASGTMAPGEEMVFDFDVGALGTGGAATYEVSFVSNSDPSVYISGHYEAYTPTENYALELSYGRQSAAGVGIDEFISFHGLLYNAGLQADNYRLTMTRDLPGDWTAAFCVGGLCYPTDLNSIDIPTAGDIPSLGTAEIDIDFLTNNNGGTGSVTVSVVSLTDGSVEQTLLFLVTTDATDVNDTPQGGLVVNLRTVPNPFNPRADIRFTMGGDTSASARVDIHDMSGRCVRTLHTGTLTPGTHSIRWDGMSADGQPAAAGVYLASVRVNNEQHMVKMTLAK